jgi:hypothetical protein
MLSIKGSNNIVHSPRNQTFKVKKAFEAILNCSCSSLELFEENEFYTDYPTLIDDNPILLEHFIDLACEIIADAFIQERYDFGDNIPEDFARNFALGIHETIVFDSTFDTCFD